MVSHSDMPAATTAIDKSGARVKRMFGEIAPHYDRMNHLLSMNVDRYWRWRAVRLLSPPIGQPILDVCTGTGDLALAFHRYGRGRSPIVAADFAPEMLDIGRAKAVRQKAGGVIDFVEADAQQLPFDDERFAVVAVAFGLRNVSDTNRGLSEMTRVCRCGGKVAILEFSMPRRQPIKALYGWYFRNVLPLIGQRLTRNTTSAYEYLPCSVGEFPSYEALTERMEQVGLRDVHYVPLTFGIATLYVGVK